MRFVYISEKINKILPEKEPSSGEMTPSEQTVPSPKEKDFISTPSAFSAMVNEAGEEENKKEDSEEEEKEKGILTEEMSKLDTERAKEKKRRKYRVRQSGVPFEGKRTTFGRSEAIIY